MCSNKTKDYYGYYGITNRQDNIAVDGSPL